jgi:hypothetical protein
VFDYRHKERSEFGHGSQFTGFGYVRYIITITSLISTLCECDEFDTAEKTLLVYGEKLQSYQSGPRDEARLLEIKAGIYRARKKYEQAETYYRSEIELLEKTSGVPPI